MTSCTKGAVSILAEKVKCSMCQRTKIGRISPDIYRKNASIDPSSIVKGSNRTNSSRKTAPRLSTRTNLHPHRPHHKQAITSTAMQCAYLSLLCPHSDGVLILRSKIKGNPPR